MLPSSTTVGSGPKKVYVPMPGAHISKTDAVGIGLSLEQFIQARGREPTVEEFADKAKAVSDPAHDAIEKRFKELTRVAWHDAARYCLDSTGYIVFQPMRNGEPIPRTGVAPIKAFVLSPANAAHAVAHDVYPLDTARTRASVKAQQTAAFESRIESFMRNHELLVGRVAMKRSVRKVLMKF